MDDERSDSESGTNPEPESDRELADAEDAIPLDHIPLHSTNLLTVLDERGVVRYESPSIERIYGFDQSDLVGQQVAEYFHPEDRERVLGAFETVVASEDYTVEAVEYRHRRADGDYVWVESVASSDPTPEGHYVVNTREITDRKARERELRETNERLDEFASVVSHDLRNPLNVATSRLELARERRDSEDLAAVAGAHDRMETLIDDLLTLARAGERVEATEPVALASATRLCWGTVATADATLRVETGADVLADESRLRQLLANLVRNAVDHAADDVTVLVDDLPAGEGSAEYRGFYVADDGPGIDRERRDEVFERGHTTRDDGTGFGLAIVAEIADAHDWTIDVTESERGGARFEITGVEFQ